jgi:hypothetical protein
MTDGQFIDVVLQFDQIEQLKPLMRRLVKILDQQEGNDRFRIQVEGLDFALEFPNASTTWSPQLRRRVIDLAGVRDVRVRPRSL